MNKNLNINHNKKDEKILYLFLYKTQIVFCNRYKEIIKIN